MARESWARVRYPPYIGLFGSQTCRARFEIAEAPRRSLNTSVITTQLESRRCGMDKGRSIPQGLRRASAVDVAGGP